MRIYVNWGDDPATDLRGVGIFGMCQLLFLFSNGLSPQMTSQLRELSNDTVQVQNVFFFVVSNKFLAIFVIYVARMIVKIFLGIEKIIHDIEVNMVIANWYQKSKILLKIMNVMKCCGKWNIMRNSYICWKNWFKENKKKMCI